MRFTFLIATLLLAGCANKLYMTYTCDPSGATLHEAETNTNFGRCPTTIEYPLTKENKAAGYVDVKGMTAT
jgi:hypothetical protein